MHQFADSIELGRYLQRIFFNFHLHLTNFLLDPLSIQTLEIVTQGLYARPAEDG
jgi:hypothetical protein